MDLIPLLFYIAAAVTYGRYFSVPNRRRGHGATATLTAAVIVHTFVIGMRTV